METFYTVNVNEQNAQVVVILVIMETFYTMYLLSNCISTG